MVGMGRELPRRGALDEEPGRLRLGLNVVVVCLRVDPPWGGTPIALPLNLRIRAKKNGKKTTELAAEMVAEIAGWLPDRRFHLRRDAALYAPAPPRTGRRGRPRTRGARLGRPPELAAAAAANDWQQVTADMRGREAARLVAVFDVLWYQVRKDALVRLVIVRDPSGIEPDDFFVTTDLSATGAQTATRYAGRWP